MDHKFNLESLGWGSRWLAPAKLNLLLKIVGRRSDGYHLLQTVFQFIDLCDVLTYSPREDSLITLRSPLLGVDEADNLVVKAARLLQEASGMELGVDIDVEKNLPMGGGLGGGSSDAATTLVALNYLWGCHLSVEQLLGLGLKLGADVPVFIRGKCAWAEGVGEILTPIALTEDWYVIVVPECHVSTQEIFASSLLTRDSEPITINDFVSGRDENDCLETVASLYRPVREAAKALSQFGEARLTGTGACIFAAFETEAKARYAERMLVKHWNVFAAKGHNESPLYTKKYPGCGSKRRCDD